MFVRCVCTLLAVAFLSITAEKSFGVTPAYLVVKQGDVFGARTVSTLNTPFTNGPGKVGFVAAFDDATRGIWHDTGFVFNSSDALPDTVTGGESTMGISNTGGFIYSPSFNGGDAVYTHAGKLQAQGDPLPPLPGLFSTFNSRPTMIPNGTAYWIGGSTATQGSSSSTNRHLFKATNVNNPLSITRVLGGGDVIDGKTVSTSASNFDYDISDNGLHHVHVLDMVTGSSANNIHVYRNGSLILQEGSAVGDGTNWENFDSVAINNIGDWVMSGDTSGNTATDEYVAFKGAIKVREGDTLDGITIASGASLRTISIDNKSNVAHIWGWGSGASEQEHLFWGYGETLGTSSVRLLSRGDLIDIDNDTIGDWIVTDFNASGVIGPGLELAEDGYVYVEVDLAPAAGGAEVEAIIRVAVPEPGTLALLLAAGFLVSRRRRN